MSARLAGWILGALALAVVLSLVLSGPVVLAVFTLAVSIAVVAKILAGRHPKEAQNRDGAQLLVSAAAALIGNRASSNGAQVA